MSVSLTELDTDTIGWVDYGNSDTYSYTHPGGYDLVVLVIPRLNSISTDISATYNGISMIEWDNTLCGSYFRGVLLYMSDPGSGTHDFVISVSGDNMSGCNVYYFGGTGIDVSGTPVEGATGSLAWELGTSLSGSHTFVNSDSYALCALFTGGFSATDITLDSPLTVVGSLIDNGLDGAAPCSKVGYEDSPGSGIQSYTGSWTGTSGDWDGSYVVELNPVSGVSAPIDDGYTAVW